MKDELSKLLEKFITNHTTIIIMSVIFSILASSLESIIVPGSLSNVFNNISDDSQLKINLIKLVIASISIKICYIIADKFKSKIEPELNYFILIELVEAVFRKYDSDNEMINISVLISKIQLIKRNIQDLFWLLFSVFFPRIVTLILGIIKFYAINPKLGLIIMVCVILQISTLLFDFTSCIDSKYTELDKKDEIMDYLEDVFNNIDMVQATYDGYNNELNKLIDMSVHSKKLEYNSLACTRKKQNSGHITNTINFVIILCAIYYLYQNGELKREDITLSLLSLTGLFENMYEITFYIPDLTQKIGIIQNNEKFLQQLLCNKHSNNSSNNSSNSDDSFKMKDNSISFRNVSFYYNNHVILNNYSIDFESNKIICIYGPSGSGKTTFVKLLFMILEPLRGEIYLGQQNISKYSKEEVRKFISFQHQNSLHLFHKTMIENILYGKNIEEDLAKANIYRQGIIDIITKFDLYSIFENLDRDKPKWSFLDVDVGKLGERLSGGQRQLVHLFRLNFNDFSRILVLDEPTSALDDVTRNKVFEYLKYLNSTGKTVIIITHDDFYLNVADNKLIFTSNTNPTFT